MRKWLYIFVALTALHARANAQGDEIYYQYADNLYLTNPAAIGLSEGTEVNLGGNRQWVGISYAPQRYFIEVNSRLNGFDPKMFRLGSMRIGVPHPALRVPKKPGQEKRPAWAIEGHAHYDEIGAFSTINAKLGLAVHFPLTDKHRLAVGARSGFNAHNFKDGRANKLIDPNDPTYEGFIKDYETRYEWVLNAGAFFYHPDYFFGYATEKRNRRRFVTESENTKNTYFSHMIVGGYNFDVGPFFRLKPAVYVQVINPQPAIVDVNLTGLYKEKIWLGIGYRSSKDLYGMGGVRFLKYYQIGYSFSMIKNSLESQSHGSHEIVLKIRTKERKRP